MGVGSAGAMVSCLGGDTSCTPPVSPFILKVNDGHINSSSVKVVE